MHPVPLSLIYFPYSSLHTLPITCHDNSFSVGVDQAQPAVLLQPGINKSGLSDFSPSTFHLFVPQHHLLSLILCPFSCPFRKWGNAFLLPSAKVSFLIITCVPHTRPGFYLIVAGKHINEIINAGTHTHFTSQVHSTLSYSHNLILGLLSCPSFCCKPPVCV